jgi:hypothetical protein
MAACGFRPVDDFDKFLTYASSVITMPVILLSPMLGIFTFFCLLDTTFAASDKMTLLLLWILVAVSLVTFLIVWRAKDVISKKLEFWLEAVQIMCLVAACCNLIASGLYRMGG